MPADAQPDGAPLEIRKALTAAWGTLEYVRAEDWLTAGESAARIARQVAALDHSQQPPRVMALLHRSLTSLQKAVAGRNVRGAEQASVDVAQSALDLEARYLAPEQIEAARFHLHSQQLRVPAAAASYSRVAGEVATLEWIRARLALDGDQARAVDDASLRCVTQAIVVTFRLQLTMPPGWLAGEEFLHPLIFEDPHCTGGRMDGDMRLPTLLRKRGTPTQIGGVARLDRRTKNLTKRLRAGRDCDHSSQRSRPGQRGGARGSRCRSCGERGVIGVGPLSQSRAWNSARGRHPVDRQRRRSRLHSSSRGRPADSRRRKS